MGKVVQTYASTLKAITLIVGTRSSRTRWGVDWGEGEEVKEGASKVGFRVVPKSGWRV